MLRTHVLCLVLLALAMMAPAAEAQTPTWSNIVYATAPTDAGGTIDLKLDIYRPLSAIGPQPAALYVHGGSWFNAGLTKSPLKQAAIPMYNDGLIVVAVDYRLSPNPPDTVEGRAIYPAHIHDVKAAIRFIRAHAAEYGIDPYRIGVYGNSAGGHLAAVAGTSADVPELEGTIGGNLEYSSRASAVVDFFGPTDILHEALDMTIPPFSSGDAADSDGPDTYIGMLIGHLPGMKDLRDNLANPNPPYPQKALLVSQTNPMTFVDPTDPPFYIAHGTSDNIVPIKQSQRLYDALVAANVTATYRIVSGGTHGNLGSSAEQAAAQWMVETLRAIKIGDANRDRSVDDDDLLILADAFGSVPGEPSWDSRTDFNFDYVVDVGDLLELVKHFGESDQSTELVLQMDLNGYAGTRDGYMSAASTGSNYNQVANMRVSGFADQGASQVRRSLVKFDLAGVVAPGTAISSAKVCLYSYNPATIMGTDGFYGLYPLTQDWGPGAVTWLRATTSATWTTPGGVFQAVPDALVARHSVIEASWYEWNVTSRVQAWINDGTSNFGWIVKLADENVHAQDDFYQSTATNPLDLRPKLVIHTSVAPEESPIGDSAVDSLAEPAKLSPAKRTGTPQRLLQARLRGTGGNLGTSSISVYHADYTPRCNFYLLR